MKCIIRKGISALKCNKCGAEINEDAKFCPMCGSLVEAGPEVQKDTYESNQPNMYGNGVFGGQRGVDAATLSRNTMRSRFNSPLFITGFILFSIMVVMNACSGFFAETIFEDMFSMMNVFSYGSYGGSAVDFEQAMQYIRYTFDSMYIVMGVVTLLMSVPSILSAIGMWITWGQSKKGYVVKTSGITLIKTGVLINMVMGIVGITVAIIASVICAVAGGMEGGYVGDILMIIMVAVVIGLIVGLVLMILYYSRLNKLLREARNAISGRAFFVPGIILICIFWGISALSALSNASTFLMVGSVYMTLFSVVQCAAYVLFVIWLVGTYSKMKYCAQQMSGL